MSETYFIWVKNNETLINILKKYDISYFKNDTSVRIDLGLLLKNHNSETELVNSLFFYMVECHNLSNFVISTKFYLYANVHFFHYLTSFDLKTPFLNCMLDSKYITYLFHRSDNYLEILDFLIQYHKLNSKYIYNLITDLISISIKIDIKIWQYLLSKISLTKYPIILDNLLRIENHREIIRYLILDKKLDLRCDDSGKYELLKKLSDKTFEILVIGISSCTIKVPGWVIIKLFIDCCLKLKCKHLEILIDNNIIDENLFHTGMVCITDQSIKDSLIIKYKKLITQTFN
jgi:hypothetical protein